MLAPELYHACCNESIFLWALGDQEFGSEVVNLIDCDAIFVIRVYTNITFVVSVKVLIV